MIDSLLDRDRLTSGERDYLDVLSDLVQRYEDQAYPMADVSDGLSNTIMASEILSGSNPDGGTTTVSEARTPGTESSDPAVP